MIESDTTTPKSDQAAPASWRPLVAALLAAVLMAGPAQAQNAALVRVETVRMEPLSQTVPVAGRLVALRSGNVAARIDAPVEKILAEVGDRVRANQVIASLDAEIAEAERDLADAEYVEAKADLQAWRAEADLAQTELKRQIGLRKSVAFSQAKYEDAQKKVAVAEARVRRAEAQMAIKRSALKRRALDVAYTTVRAPYEGVIVQRFTEAGAYVSKGEPLVKLIGIETLELEADVPARRVAGLTIGRKIAFRLDDGSMHMATVRAQLPSENPLTRTRLVRLTPIFKGDVSALAESQSAIVLVPVGAERRVLTVHKDAILKRQGGDLVYVVADGVANPRQITLGEPVGSRIEVLTGLKAGEQVVIRGNERLRPGAKVRIEKGSS